MTDEYEQLIGALALGAVDEDERRAAREAVRRDPALHAELRRHRGVAAALAAGLLEGTEEAPAHLWEQIETHLEPEPASVSPISVKRRPWVAAALLAAAVAVIAVLGVQVALQRSEIADLRDDPVSAALEEARAAGASEISLTGAVEADIVLAADGTGYLLGDKLPALTPEQTYQLWAVIGDRVISAGVLGSAPSVAAFSVSGDVDAFALTVEVAGGVAVSEQDPVAIAEVGA